MPFVSPLTDSLSLLIMNFKFFLKGSKKGKKIEKIIINWNVDEKKGTISLFIYLVYIVIDFYIIYSLSNPLTRK